MTEILALFTKTLSIAYNSNILLKIVFIIFCLHYIIIKTYFEHNLKNQPLSTFLYKYKITNFTVTNIYCHLYIMVTSIILIYIYYRILTIPIDLKLQIRNLLHFCTGVDIWNTLLITILLCLLCYILLDIFIKINRFFIKELKSIYLIYEYMGEIYIDDDYEGQEPSPAQYIIKSKVFLWKPLIINVFRTTAYFFLHRVIYYCVEFIIVDTLWDKRRGPILKALFDDTKKEEYTKFFYKILKFIFYKLFSYFIILFFLYELIFNNFVLSLVFNHCLFIYILYSIYKKASHFICNTNKDLNSMIFNMYYKSRSIKYVNIPLDFQLIVYHYIFGGLQIPLTLTNKKQIRDRFFIEIMLKHLYTTEDYIRYVSGNSERYFIMESDNNIQDIFENVSDRYQV